MSEGKKEYRYREGVHGEHCVDYGKYEWVRLCTIGRAVTEQDARTMVAELNTVMDGTKPHHEPQT